MVRTYIATQTEFEELLARYICRFRNPGIDPDIKMVPRDIENPVLDNRMKYRYADAQCQPAWYFYISEAQSVIEALHRRFNVGRKDILEFVISKGIENDKA